MSSMLVAAKPRVPNSFSAAVRMALTVSARRSAWLTMRAPLSWPATAGHPGNDGPHLRNLWQEQLGGPQSRAMTIVGGERSRTLTNRLRVGIYRPEVCLWRGP